MAADLQRARTVRDQLVEQLRAEPVVNGVGLVRRTGGWAVKVNLACSAPHLELPSEIDGVEVLTDVVGPIVAQ